MTMEWLLIPVFILCALIMKLFIRVVDSFIAHNLIPDEVAESAKAMGESMNILSGDDCSKGVSISIMAENEGSAAECAGPAQGCLKTESTGSAQGRLKTESAGPAQGRLKTESAGPAQGRLKTESTDLAQGRLKTESAGLAQENSKAMGERVVVMQGTGRSMPENSDLITDGNLKNNTKAAANAGADSFAAIGADSLAATGADSLAATGADSFAAAGAYTAAAGIKADANSGIKTAPPLNTINSINENTGSEAADHFQEQEIPPEKLSFSELLDKIRKKRNVRNDQNEAVIEIGTARPMQIRIHNNE